MKPHRRHLIAGLGAAALGSVAAHAWGFGRADGWRCPDCGCSMDDRVFGEDGKCPDCGMTLVRSQAGGGSPDTMSVSVGSGSFQIPGGAGRETARITVYYHRPASFGPDSPMLLVLPGSGRNADEYRDAWLDASEAKGILVAGLSYPEQAYDFAAYQMGGTIRNLRIDNPPLTPQGTLPDVLNLKDEAIHFETETRPDHWLFPDFDRTFDAIVKATASRRTAYDIFGHSAGGQILHRLAMFKPDTRAARIVAGNSGIYTQPDLNRPAYIGLQGSGVTEAMLRQGFGRDLTVMLGGADSDPERGGQHLHTPMLDQTGRDRLARGRYFYASAQEEARKLGVDLKWKLEVVPNVGHDYRAMSRAAAALLYG